MKKLSNVLYIILLIINIIAWLLFTDYSLFNMLFNNIVLLMSIALTLWINKNKIDDAFRISLSFTIPFITFIQLIVGCLSPDHFQDNWAIITDLVLLTFEFLLIYSILKKSGNKINQDAL